HLQRLRRRDQRPDPAPALRSGEVRSHRGQHHAGAVRVRQVQGGQGKARPGAVGGQFRQDHGRPGDGGRRLRHALPRQAAVPVPAHRRQVLVRGLAGGTHVSRRAAQLQPAGRLPDHGRPRAGPGHRADVGFRHRQGGRGLLQGLRRQVQLPGQPRPGRPGQHLPPFPATGLRRSRADRVVRHPAGRRKQTRTHTRRFPMKRIALAAALSLFAASAFAAPVTYKLDPNHTMVVAQWNHFGFSNPYANFGDADGTLVYDADDVSASSVAVTLPLTGLDSFSDDFDKHLWSADFFDIARFPAATFKSTSVEVIGEGELKVTGDLTIPNTPRPVVLDVTLNKAAEHPMTKRAAIGFDATAAIKRSDFVLAMYVPNVGDEVKLRITTEAMAPAAEAAE